jgi:hypothetical protein
MASMALAIGCAMVASRALTGNVAERAGQHSS